MFKEQPATQAKLASRATRVIPDHLATQALPDQPDLKDRQVQLEQRVIQAQQAQPAKQAQLEQRALRALRAQPAKQAPKAQT